MKKDFKIFCTTCSQQRAILPTAFDLTLDLFLGSIVIEKGNDRGSTNITIAELTGQFTDTNSRNVAHVRSRFEIREIDQIVLRLNRIEGN